MFKKIHNKNTRQKSGNAHLWRVVLNIDRICLNFSLQLQ